MSRTLLVALLFALLCVSLSNSASAACANGCSNNGVCVGSTWCNCTVGYVGLDCGVKTGMAVQCWVKGDVCSQWGVQGGAIYQRVWASNTTADGWVGVMWGATDGMSGGQSTIFSLVSGTVTAFDGYNVKKGKPTNLTDQSVAPQNVSGGVSGHGLDVSFVRLLDTGLQSRYKIPAAKGTASTFSVAYAQSFFEFHGEGAEFVKSIDIVGVASAAESTYANNRHSKLAALKAPL